MSNGNYVAAIDLAHCFGILDTRLNPTPAFEALRSSADAQGKDMLSLQLGTFLRKSIAEEWHNFDKNRSIERLEQFLEKLPPPAPSKTKLPRQAISARALFDFVVGIMNNHQPPRKAGTRERLPQYSANWHLAQDCLSGEYLLSLNTRVHTEEDGKILQRKLSHFLASLSQTSGGTPGEN